MTQSAFLDDEDCDLIGTFATLQIRKKKNGRLTHILSASASITAAPSRPYPS
jgi:hypothetical protein